MAVATATLHRPETFGNVDYWQEDSLSLLFFFHAPNSDTPVDVSGCAFTSKVFAHSNPQILTPTLDMSEAQQGKIRTSFTADQIATFPRYVQLSLKETLRWRRTILVVRLVRADWYAFRSEEPEITDQTESIVRIAIDGSAVPNGVTWNDLGDVTWDELGTIEWENI